MPHSATVQAFNPQDVVVNSPKISNVQFLQAIFGDEYQNAHVTSFPYDPGAIPKEKNLVSWRGGYFKDTPLIPKGNQFYTVSLFRPDEEGRGRRRKNDYIATYVIGLDDVKEKLSLEMVNRLPAPSIKLKSSLHSEQWLYILATPETDRNRVDNLLDGLVANGLAPKGIDPGMKGVTRYLRLPEGYNTKAKRVEENGGTAPQCEITEFEPSRRYTLEDLATPFFVDLDKARREARVDGAADLPDHPLLQIPEFIHVKAALSAGRYDITCPWVGDHTGQEDNGSVIITNQDGTAGFKCHHGNCQERTINDVYGLIEEQQVQANGFMDAPPSIREEMKKYEQDIVFKELMSAAPAPAPAPSEPVSSAPAPVSSESAPDMPAAPIGDIDDAIKALRRESPNSPKAQELTNVILKLAQKESALEKRRIEEEVADVLRISKPDFKKLLKALQAEWYGQSISGIDMLDRILFVKDQNRFFDTEKMAFHSRDSFHNSYCDVHADIVNIALDGGCQKVDRVDFAPRMPAVFTDLEDGIVYGNLWREDEVMHGREGDCSPWLAHFGKLGWEENREHILQWMAYTIRYPDIKINHMIALTGGEGCGKDFILTPLKRHMRGYCREIGGYELASDFNSYLMKTKYLHFNEVEVADSREAVAIANKLKPLTSAPPTRLSVNEKGVKPVEVRNIVNCTMTSNSQTPIKISGVSRRIYGVHTDVSMRGPDGDQLPEWAAYWANLWGWMNNPTAGPGSPTGLETCIYYLMHTIDLSNFHPGAQPPMTDFVRDLAEYSKSSADSTIENFINHRVGAFAGDLITTDDAVQSLRNVTFSQEGLLDLPKEKFNRVLVGRAFAKGTPVQLVMRDPDDHSRKTLRVWCIRNSAEISKLSMAERFEMHQAFIKDRDFGLPTDPTPFLTKQ